MTKPLPRRKAKAALLVADDKLTDVQIAEQIGITKMTLERWKLDPVFAAAVAEHRAAWQEELRGKGIADKRNRVAALDRRARLLEDVIAARAADEATAKGPGGDTGLIVRQLKVIGQGEAASLVEEFTVDTGLLRELREHEKQAAQEMGEWVEKRDVDHSGSVVLIRGYEGIDPDFV